MKRFFTCCVTGLLAISGGSVEAQTVVYEHTFDEVANDSTPAVQAFDNGAGTPMITLETGAITNAGSSGGGFNTTSGIDLSALSEFTVEFIVESNYSGISGAGLNGSFFGITNSTTSNATDGTALYNNAGNDGPPVGTSIGLTVGTGRGVPGPDFVLDQVSGNGTFTAIFDPDVEILDDETDGYSVYVNYANDSTTGNTTVTITSCGLATELDLTVVTEVDFATLAANVTPNTSSQGGVLDLASITITDGPAPGCPAAFPLGDVNQDTVVNFLDITPFIAVLSSGGFQFEADITGEGVVNFLDITPFIAILSGS